MNETADALAVIPNDAADPLGLRLRRARERLQLSTAEVAAKLKMATALVDAIEREDFARFGAPIYARGYLLSYVRLMGLPEVVVEKALSRSTVSAPQLHSAASVPPLRHYFERYAMRSVYVVLTAAIIVPIVWLAIQRPNLVPISDVRSLDAPELPLAQSAGTLPASAADAQPEPPADATSSAPSVDTDAPVMASMAPFYNVEPEPEPAAAMPSAPIDAVEPSAVATATGWTFRFKSESWVDLKAADGSRLMYGIVPAGTEKQFAEGALARVALGNAEAVEVLHAGQSLNLQPYRRANVARFAISSEGDIAALERAARPE